MSKNTDNFCLPVLGFAAFSGTGKTTLLVKLIGELTNRKVRIGVIKQSHHDVEIDIPGKDSYQLRKAGASQTLLTSPRRWALIHEDGVNMENDLPATIECLDTGTLDLVLVEGFRHYPFPKIELNRSELEKPFLFPEDDSIIAIATDRPEPVKNRLPVLDINNPQEIMDFIYLKFL